MMKMPESQFNYLDRRMLLDSIGKELAKQLRKCKTDKEKWDLFFPILLGMTKSKIKG